MRRLLRFAARGLAVLVVLGLVAIGVLWWLWRGSLPQLEGEAALPGLSAPVTVERDALGVVTIDAANELDAYRAIGFVHAQERFFEMDLLRRSAAGELSALFGERALERDKAARVHRLRARLAQDFEAFAGGRLAQLEAYRDGVNAGLQALARKPWAYELLQAEPQPWTVEDSALVGYAMFFDLQDEANSRELALWRIREVVPPALYALVARDGSAWDAPLLGDPRGDAPLPGADELDLRTLPVPAATSDGEHSEAAAPGSNNFAVAGTLTADGRAILANDMHLGLRAPNLWFRARLRWPDTRAPDGRVDVAGFTLPGLPSVIAGSNTRVAWGFTNSYGDWLDFYKVEWSGQGDGLYYTHDGQALVLQTTEWIEVRGRERVPFVVRDTRWGPIVADLPDGNALALRWSAQLPGALNLGLADMVFAPDVDHALLVADGAGIPAQNLLVADAGGRIAWRLTGRLPDRRGDCTPTLPMSVDAPCRWVGWLDPIHNPQIVDPPSGRLWSANNRLVDGEALALVGDAGYAHGARARQIRDGLFARESFTETDLLAIQLDDRALFLQRWHELLAAEAQRGDPALQALAAAAADWNGRADPASAGYRIVRGWRLAVLGRLQQGLLAPAMAALGDDFVMPDLPQFEAVAWPLLEQRPAHLLPRAYASWDALLADAAGEVRSQLEATGPLAQRRWGERNTAAICHPLAAALPAFTRGLLCMPADRLAGDGHMPRVQSPAFGASERMVVAPGHEAEGIVHMPGGQSGHPLSPFWGAGHADWVRGDPSPFLPGPAQYRLRLSAEL
ncbi:penicillin acylase family protein [Arenimonas composti]|uniref:penicillin acylase family protein n=1 Tax=Arenimonas composti TaxID=370776 RepID=UPI0005C1E3F7|nr:penicillin acylase family protein [Arenimonas composti]